MASQSWFIYTADDSTDYKVYLEDWLAVAAGFVEAIGTELILPDSITMRYGLGRVLVAAQTATIPIPFPTSAALEAAYGTDLPLGGTRTARIIAVQGQGGGANLFLAYKGDKGDKGDTGEGGVPTCRTYHTVGGTLAKSAGCFAGDLGGTFQIPTWNSADGSELVLMNMREFTTITFELTETGIGFMHGLSATGTKIAVDGGTAVCYRRIETGDYYAGWWLLVGSHGAINAPST
jgi:hypothetical protein